MQFKRCAVRQEVGCGTGELTRDQVRAVNVLSGSAEFEGHEVVQTGLQSRHQATLLSLVHEIAGRCSRQSGDRAHIRQGERRPAPFIQLGEKLRCTRPQRLRLQLIFCAQSTPQKETKCTLNITSAVVSGNLTSARDGRFRTISYTSFNLPDANAGIQGASGSPQYRWSYDENHARIQERRTNANGTRTTWTLNQGLGFELEELNGAYQRRNTNGSYDATLNPTRVMPPSELARGSPPCMRAMAAMMARPRP